MLFPLALLGFICAFRKVEALGFSLDQRRHVQIAFALVLVIWATVFNKLSKNRASRSRQRWGMKDFDATSMERVEYDPDLEGTWQLWVRNCACCV